MWAAFTIFYITYPHHCFTLNNKHQTLNTPRLHYIRTITKFAKLWNRSKYIY